LANEVVPAGAMAERSIGARLDASELADNVPSYRDSLPNLTEATIARVRHRTHRKS